MALQQYSRSIVTNRLYRIFRIKDEEYIITLKLVAIYGWRLPIDGENVYESLGKLRQENRQFSNRRTIDCLYEQGQNALYKKNERFAPGCEKPPQQEGLTVIGWKVA